MADKTPIPSSRLQGVFSKKKKVDESGVMNHESDNHDSGNTIHESGTASIDPKILEWAISKGRDDPRISGYFEFQNSA